MSDLLPCPFCGGRAWLNDYEARHGDLASRSRCPQCASCGCNLGYLPTARKATEAWNLRTRQPEGGVSDATSATLHARHSG